MPISPSSSPAGKAARIHRLQVRLGHAGRVGMAPVGWLNKASQYTFFYDGDASVEDAVSLRMLPRQAAYVHGDLFSAMDMNLPEGELLQQVVLRRPMLAKTKMGLLSLMCDNGIGRVGFVAENEGSALPPAVDRRMLLESASGPVLFDQLAGAYLLTSIGVSGVQPKLLLPSRAMVPVPDLIVKLAGDDFPGLSANEYLCLDAARRAGIEVSGFALSADGSILVIDRFDVTNEGHRLGFEDIAALMGRQVHDRLSNRKYEGSYEALAQAIQLFSAQPAQDLLRFFDQLALTVMVRNGDAHLKNFGLLYSGPQDARLAPMFDVVTTTIYKYQRPGGVEAVDRTLALKLRAGRHGSRAYPDTEALSAFGSDVCGVRRPQQVLDRIAQAMGEALAAAAHDPRIAPALLADMQVEWARGQGHATRT